MTTTDNPLGLRPFQLDAVNHLDGVPGVLFAHDPGLGKTFMAGDRDRRIKLLPDTWGWLPTLVLCPKPLLYTWGEWYSKHRPDVKVCVVDPTNATTRRAFTDQLATKSAEVFILHYEGLKLLLPQVEPVHWTHIIADEVHKISNRKTKTSLAVRALNSTWKTGLSGTPADRAPDQIWAVFNFLDRKVWSSYWRFRERYVSEWVDPVRGFRQVTGSNPHTLPELHKKMKPFVVRARKSQVLKDLPPKQYKNIWVDLSPLQRKHYEAMRKDMLAWVGKQEDKPLSAAVVVAQLIRLQQIAMATPDFRTKIVRKRLKCVLPRDHEGECIEPEDDAADSEWHGKFYEVEVEEIFLDDPSTKLDAAMGEIEQIVEAGEQVVVFSQFSRAIDLLEKRLNKAGISNGKYHGGVRQSTRNKLEQEFAAGEISVFAGTIKAGGTGLNLQTASNAIFLDREWTGGANLQPEDRIHRIGQLAPKVNITDIMALKTVDKGRHQHFRKSWHEVQLMLGDQEFDWQHSLEEEEAPA